MKMKVCFNLIWSLFTMTLFCLSAGCGGGGGSNPVPTTVAVPVAAFTVSPSTGSVPVMVTFTDRSTNNPTDWLWNFGDGTTSTNPNPTHSYANPGTYTVSLKATNAAGSSNPATYVYTANPAIPPAPTNPVVNGTKGQNVTDGTNLFIVTLRNQDVYVTKFDSSNNVLWEKPILVTSGWDECRGAAFMNGFLYFICVQDDVSLPGMATGTIWFEKLDPTTGDKVKETVLVAYGAPSGLASDPATTTLYSYYSNRSGVGSEIRIDPTNGTILNSAQEQQYVQSGMQLTEQFGITVVGSDGAYVVGSIMQNAAQNRIYIVKFTKDLQTRLWSAQYRNFADSQYLDLPSSAYLSQAGYLIVEGTIDILGNAQSVKLQIDPTTGSITVL